MLVCSCCFRPFSHSILPPSFPALPTQTAPLTVIVMSISSKNSVINSVHPLSAICSLRVGAVSSASTLTEIPVLHVRPPAQAALAPKTLTALLVHLVTQWWPPLLPAPPHVTLQPPTQSGVFVISATLPAPHALGLPRASAMHALSFTTEPYRMNALSIAVLASSPLEVLARPAPLSVRPARAPPINIAPPVPPAVSCFRTSALTPVLMAIFKRAPPVSVSLLSHSLPLLLCHLC